MSPSHDSHDSHGPRGSDDTSIPVLSDVLVAGSPVRARHPSAEAAAPAAAPVEDVLEAPAPPGAPTPAPTDVPPPVVVATTEEPVVAPEDVPHVAAHASPQVAPEVAREVPSAVAPQFPPEHRQTVAPAFVPQPAPVDDATEVATTPFAEPYAPELARGNGAHEIDADLLAERLRGRLASYLGGEGRELIEERCQAAMRVHATWLVGQIAREVASALEVQIAGWVKDAVKEEAARRSDV
ncbi:DUF2486 family protein [Paraburkholderia sp. BL10I2N1]|uniref:DUF2486 family protein n=1 Tax=Paraburkholderia sp. BL10I2N1 TaxID=1938796 RepID=UPI0010E54C8B|nr:DUF2486 family protein [Paraburkholderia sp. BL10I2N1]TDN66985.1 uncharacterized protein DUF2486 [Paraburkholderia sp. BL10I2N1]